MSTAESPTSQFLHAEDEAQIRNIQHDLMEAMHAGDTERYLSHFSPEVVIYDFWGSTFAITFDELKGRMVEGFASLQGQMQVTINSTTIAVNGDVAFSFGTLNSVAQMPDKPEMRLNWRDTTCYRKEDGRWLITHQHSSVPVNMETGKGETELTA